MRLSKISYSSMDLYKKDLELFFDFFLNALGEAVLHLFLLTDLK